MVSFEQLAGDSVIREKFNRLKSEFPDRIKLLQVKTIGKEFLLQQELMLISYPSWKGLVDSKSLWLEHWTERSYFAFAFTVIAGIFKLRRRIKKYNPSINNTPNKSIDARIDPVAAFQ